MMINTNETILRERLAELAHSQWSGWMKYLFSKGEFNEDGTWTMPAWAVKRWTTQMNTPYAQLSDDEKESDRKEADKFLDVFYLHQAELKRKSLRLIEDEILAKTRT